MKQPNDALTLLTDAKQYLLSNKVSDSDLEAKYIVSFVLGIKPHALFLDQSLHVSRHQRQRIKRMLKKRVQGKPLQYILNQQDFYGLSFYVDKNVLIPRSETELLVEKTLAAAKAYVAPKILDLCTGSGCIAVALKKHLKSAAVYASDQSKKALKVAKKNAKLNHTDISFYHSDLLSDIDETFDIIVSNPPYINAEDYYLLDKKVLDHEPKMALLGGDDGMLVINRIIKQSRKKLNDNGFLLLEIGHDQKAAACNALKEKSYQDIKSFPDYAGLDRIVIGRK